MSDMRIIRIFNNNVALAVDDDDNEKMVLGNGIGFNTRVNDSLDSDKIEKIFVLETSNKKREFEQAMQFASAEYVELTKMIIEEAEKELEVTFNDSIFIGLLDHISYALQRISQKRTLKNALIWEIRKFYTREFNAAIKSLQIIEEEEHIRLSEDEAGFIAMHFVNGQQNEAEEKSPMLDAKVIQDILNIIKYHFKMELDEATVGFSEFITHMRCLLQRLRQVHEAKNSIENELFDQVCKKYTDSYSCVKKISFYLEKKLGVILTNDDVLYLMLHINHL
jgi:beta-glucoside operon transcriptional antiterminator